MGDGMLNLRSTMAEGCQHQVLILQQRLQIFLVFDFLLDDEHSHHVGRQQFSVVCCNSLAPSQ